MRVLVLKLIRVRVMVGGFHFVIEGSGQLFRWELKP